MNPFTNYAPRLRAYRTPEHIAAARLNAADWMDRADHVLRVFPDLRRDLLKDGRNADYEVLDLSLETLACRQALRRFDPEVAPEAGTLSDSLDKILSDRDVRAACCAATEEILDPAAWLEAAKMTLESNTLTNEIIEAMLNDFEEANLARAAASQLGYGDGYTDTDIDDDLTKCMLWIRDNAREIAFYAADWTLTRCAGLRSDLDFCPFLASTAVPLDYLLRYAKQRLVAEMTIELFKLAFSDVT